MEEESGQVYYLSRQPQVKITKRSQLVGYHSKGRYTEMSLETLNFGKKRRLNKYSLESKDLFENPDSCLESDKKMKKDFPCPIDEALEASNYENDNINSKDANASNSQAQNFVQWRDSSMMVEQIDMPNERDSTSMVEKIDMTKVRDSCSLVEQIDMPRERDSTSIVEKIDMPKDKYSSSNVEQIDMTKEKRFSGGTKFKDNQKKEAQLNSERLKLENAVSRLTLNTDAKVIDHKKALLETAKVLNDRRRRLDHVDLADFNFDSLKAKIQVTKNYEELLIVLNTNSLIEKSLSSLAQSKILEQLLKISSLPENPLKEFPMDINKNHYEEVIHFALNHAPDVLDLILKLSTKNETPVSPTEVVRCAYMFSSLASTVNRKNNALKKMKSVSIKTQGTTNVGLDDLANVGVVETSRNFRKVRDFLASINDMVLKSYAQNSVPQVQG